MAALKRILILSFTESSRAPRVYRQILFLKDHYNLFVAGYGALEMDGVRFCQIAEPHPQHIIERIVTRAIRIARLKTRRFEEYYWSQSNVQDAFEKLREEPVDLIIAHDLQTLPLSVRLANIMGAKVLVDLHEYEPKHLDHLWRFRFMYFAYWDYICREYLSQADCRITVCQGIADEYEKVYGASCAVVTNAPFYEDVSPQSVVPEKIRIIHHGLAHTGRNLENMIFLMDSLDERFHLDFMLFANIPAYLPYLQKLQQLARDYPRIRFLDPVPMPDIVRTIKQYDIGLFLLLPHAFNYKMALPNKLFEYIQARLAVAIWPSPEMARLVRQYDCGVVADDFSVEAMAAKLNRLSAENILYYKHQSHQAAHALSAETNQKIMLELVRDLIGI